MENLNIIIYWKKERSDQNNIQRRGEIKLIKISFNYRKALSIEIDYLS